MNIRIYISFNEGRKRYHFVRHLLEAIGCETGLAGEDDFLCGLYGRTFDIKDPRLESFRSTLERENIRWSERFEYIYADKELQSFPLLDLRVNRKEISAYGPNYGTTYDLSTGCPNCGTGVIQQSAFLAPAKDFPKTGLLCNSSTEIFVSAPLANALIAANVTGLELRQARSYSGNEPLPWWQMISTFEMPKMSSATKNLRRDTNPNHGCAVCQRDGYGESVKYPSEIYYDQSMVKPCNFPDVVQTWERFGKSGIHWDDFKNSRFAPPLILVKPKVFDIFRKLKVKYAEFQPVRIE